VLGGDRGALRVSYGFDGTWYPESYDEMARGLVDALTVAIVIGWGAVRVAG
jgi:hypothetical protein